MSTLEKPTHELKPIPSWLVFSLIVAPLAFIGLIVHELGHGLTAQALGGEMLALWVFPGVELWPDFGASYNGRFTYMGLVRYLNGPDWTDTQSGWATLMGTGSTFIISVLALITLLVTQPKRRLTRFFLLSLALWYLDLLTYAIFPQLGLPHWVIVGGRTPEPVLGAELLGINRTLFTVAVVVICTGMTALLYRYLRNIPDDTPDL